MNETQITDSFTVEEPDLRLDKLLTKRFSEHSRTYFQYLIENGSVLLNGKTAKKRICPNVGDEIEVFFILSPEIDMIPQPIPLDILYEDDDLICINKPTGMVVHPAPGHPSGTFANALLHHCSNIALPGVEFRPGIVHRIDKETSGVLIAAKTLAAHQGLIEQFSERKVEKEYLAITVGHPEAKEIKTRIGRNPRHRKEMTVVDSGGKEAITIITPLSRGEHFSLISAKLITGRTHQIRVHLKHNNTPILGDPLYGFSKLNEKYHVERQMLHAHRLQITHPIKNTPLSVIAPLPRDMQHVKENFLTLND